MARAIVDRGFTKSYDYALQTMRGVPYGRWRQYDPLKTAVAAQPSASRSFHPL